MSDKKEIQIKDFSCNPFEEIGKNWMLITSEKDGQVNTMTASWGGMGVIWSKNVVYVFIRKSRYTKEFVDASGKFSLTFLDPEKYRKEQAYLGKVSGRDEDKIAKSGLTVENTHGVPYFKEGKMVILCKCLSCHNLAPEGFLDDTIDSQCYANGDYHDMYVGEILQILEA